MKVTKARGEMKCKHQFFETSKIIDSIGDNPITNRMSTTYKSGVKVMCALCGLQRHLWDNGDMEEKINDEWEML
jgi:hypothetical protein